MKTVQLVHGSAGLHANRIPLKKGAAWVTDVEAAKGDEARARELGGEFLAAYLRWKKVRFFVERRLARAGK